MRAGAQLAALRHPFQVVPPAEIQQLARLGRQGEGQDQINDTVRVGAVVAQFRPGAQQTGRQQFQGERQGQPAVLVGRDHVDRARPAGHEIAVLRPVRMDGFDLEEG